MRRSWRATGRAGSIFAPAIPNRVEIEFEGPSLELKLYTAQNTGGIGQGACAGCRAAFLPPKWMYGTWRWRDENRPTRANYYDGTPVAGPFNSGVHGGCAADEGLRHSARGSIGWTGRGRRVRWATTILKLTPTGCRISAHRSSGSTAQASDVFVDWHRSSRGTWPATRWPGAGRWRRRDRIAGAGNFPLCDFTNPAGQKILAGWRGKTAEARSDRIQT